MDLEDVEYNFVNDCFEVRVYPKPSTDLNMKVLLLSDLHLDSKKSDREQIKLLMDNAVKDNSIIFIFGDVVDVMGAKYDRRTTKSDIKDEYNEQNYFDLIAEDIANFLLPYIDNIALITAGNHEKESDIRRESRILTMVNLYLHKFCGKELNISNKYAGYIKFMFNLGTIRTSKTMFYSHGNDGNAPMTFGVLNVKRRAAIVDADIIVTGHIHNAWSKPLERMYLTQEGYVKTKEQIHIQLGTIKKTNIINDYFSARKGFDPANATFYYIRFYYDFHSHGRVNYIEERIK